MRTLFLSSSGLNEKTTKLFWECIGKEPQNTKVIFVPSAAIGNDGARGRLFKHFLFYFRYKSKKQDCSKGEKRVFGKAVES